MAMTAHGVHVPGLGVRLHAACASPSFDWLNDFLKGCRAAISFQRLITVRSPCAPADPLWYGLCTRPRPLSQVPIIIIKPPSPSIPRPSPWAGWWTRSLLGRGGRGFDLGLVLTVWPDSLTLANTSCQWDSCQIQLKKKTNLSHSLTTDKVEQRCGILTKNCWF